MCNNAVPAQRMILIVDVLHDLAIRDRIVPLLDISLVAFVEAIPKKRDHRHADCFLILRLLFEPFDLSMVLSGNDCHSQHAELLDPVLLNGFNYDPPIHGHPFLLSNSNPCPAAVVIGNALNPCTRIAVPDRTLLPRSACAIPYCRIHIRHGDHAGGHAGIVAGIAGGRGSLGVVLDQRGVAFRKIHLHGIEQSSVGRRVQCMGYGIAVEFAGQCPQRIPDL